MSNGEAPMLIRTSIALAAAAFLGFTAVAEAESGGSRMESSDRQSEGFSSQVGSQGQYFGSTAPRPGYYSHYDYSPAVSVHRNRRKGMVPPTK
jgi:hypothetical protein